MSLVPFLRKGSQSAPFLSREPWPHATGAIDPSSGRQMDARPLGRPITPIANGHHTVHRVKKCGLEARKLDDCMTIRSAHCSPLVDCWFCENAQCDIRPSLAANKVSPFSLAREQPTANGPYSFQLTLPGEPSTHDMLFRLPSPDSEKTLSCVKELV